MGNVIELIFRSGGDPPRIPIRRLDADRFLDERTGEIRYFRHTENRSENVRGVARTLEKLRDLLNTNIVDVSFCRWLTLTYAENMRDSNRLYEDFKAFNRRMRKRVGRYEYIAAAEPQGRGAWHLHVVMIFDHKAPFIPSEDVSADWRQGFVKIKKLDDVDNVGAYLTAYLGDMEFDEARKMVGLKYVFNHEMKVVEFLDENGQAVSKSYVKGARLHLYPSKFNLYRCSRGIKKPIIEVTTEEKAKEKVSSAKLTFEKTLELSDMESGFSCVLNYRYYNRVRKDSKS